LAKRLSYIWLRNFFLDVISGLLTELVRSRWQRKKPLLVQIEKQGQASLISMPPDARNRLKVVYKGKRTRNIDDLHQTSFKIYSTGEQPVQNVKCQIAFEDLDSEDLLEVTIEDTIPEETREAKTELVYTPDSYFSISLHIPFLNLYQQYQDTVLLQVYSAKPIKVKRIIGGGLGWNVKYFDKVEYNENLQKVITNIDSPANAAIFLINTIFKKVYKSM